jgi:hypothetical protein
MANVRELHAVCFVMVENLLYHKRFWKTECGLLDGEAVPQMALIKPLLPPENFQRNNKANQQPREQYRDIHPIGPERRAFIHYGAQQCI